MNELIVDEDLTRVDSRFHRSRVAKILGET